MKYLFNKKYMICNTDPLFVNSFPITLLSCTKDFPKIFRRFCFAKSLVVPIPPITSYNIDLL